MPGLKMFGNGLAEQREPALQAGINALLITRHCTPPT